MKLQRNVTVLQVAPYAVVVRDAGGVKQVAAAVYAAADRRTQDPDRERNHILLPLTILSGYYGDNDGASLKKKKKYKDGFELNADTLQTADDYSSSYPAKEASYAASDSSSVPDKQKGGGGFWKFVLVVLGIVGFVEASGKKISKVPPFQVSQKQ